jgi:hypothetical protein
MKNLWVDKRWLALFFVLALIYKIYAWFQVPEVTSDVFRNLGYASHATENNFAIYTTKAMEFAPEAWTQYWSEQTYIYPPATLLFFFLFSSLHLGIFWVKVTLTIVDLCCTYLFYTHVSALAAVLFFSSPIMLWYSAHEGQFEVLQTFFIILNAVAIKKKHWRLSGLLLAISIQIKQLGVLILPWMLYEMWREQKTSKSFILNLIKVAQGLALGFIPFLPWYIRKPNLLLLPIIEGSDLIYNPFAWNIFHRQLFGWNPVWLILWNTLFSYIPLILILRAMLFQWHKKEKIFSAIPLVSFWTVVKSLKWGQFWYPIIYPGFIFCLSSKNFIHVVLFFHFLQCLHSIVSILHQPFGAVESEFSRSFMESCMYLCNPQQLHL